MRQSAQPSCLSPLTSGALPAEQTVPDTHQLDDADTFLVRLPAGSSLSSASYHTENFSPEAICKIYYCDVLIFEKVTIKFTYVILNLRQSQKPLKLCNEHLTYELTIKETQNTDGFKAGQDSRQTQKQHKR